MIAHPAYGAMPLAKTFFYTRILQVIAMIVILGITANFISEIVFGQINPPQEVVGALVVTCLATLYTLVSIAFFFSEACLGLLIMAGADFLILIAWIIVAVTLGKPTSFLICSRYPGSLFKNDTSGSDAAAYADELRSTIGFSGDTVPLYGWASATKSYCYQTKTIWGMAISLCILFTVSCVLLPTLFMKNKKAAPPKDVEG